MCKVNCPSLVGDILVEHDAIEDARLQVLIRALLDQEGLIVGCLVLHQGLIC